MKFILMAMALGLVLMFPVSGRVQAEDAPIFGVSFDHEDRIDYPSDAESHAGRMTCPIRSATCRSFVRRRTLLLPPSGV